MLSRNCRIKCMRSQQFHPRRDSENKYLKIVPRCGWSVSSGLNLIKSEVYLSHYPRSWWVVCMRSLVVGWIHHLGYGRHTRREADAVPKCSSNHANPSRVTSPSILVSNSSTANIGWKKNFGGSRSGIEINAQSGESSNENSLFVFFPFADNFQAWKAFATPRRCHR